MRTVTSWASWIIWPKLPSNCSDFCCIVAIASADWMKSWYLEPTMCCSSLTLDTASVSSVFTNWRSSGMERLFNSSSADDTKLDAISF